MIDPDLVEDPLVKQALIMLADSGILRAQQVRLQERFKFGDADETDESLLKAIRQCRQESMLLESLHQYGEALKSKGEVI